MDRFSILLAFFLFSSAVVEASKAALSTQLYWHAILPNTPMPKAICDLILSDVEMEKKGAPVGFLMAVPTRTPVYINYNYHTEEVSVADLMKSSAATLFFLEKDLHPGGKMTLQFQSTPFKVAFLPRAMAESIPFSSKNLTEIFRYFSINPTSLESQTVINSLQTCEAPPALKERKHCAKSIESMVDFAMSNLGTLDVTVLSTNVGKEGRPKQVYTIGPSGVHKMTGLDIASCHIMAYPYGLFYCHSSGKARAYAIEIEGEDGAMVEAAAVCHMDTSNWNPNYVGLRVLKVSPGTPVCHFLPPDDVLWAHNN